MPSRSLLIALALRLVVAGVGIAAIAPAFGAGPAVHVAGHQPAQSRRSIRARHNCGLAAGCPGTQ